MDSEGNIHDLPPELDAFLRREMARAGNVGLIRMTEAERRMLEGKPRKFRRAFYAQRRREIRKGRQPQKIHYAEQEPVTRGA